MGLSFKLYLISTDETVQMLASAAYMGMLRREGSCGVPDFAGQRVRQAIIAVETADGIPTRIAYCTFSVLDFDGDGFLDVDRLLAQQFARVGG